MADRSSLSDRLANLSPAKRALLEKRLRGEQTAVPTQQPSTIPRQPQDEPAVLSFAQERLWFLQQLTPNSTAYNMHEAVEWQGQLNVTALQTSLNQLVARHPSLRTAFRNQNGRPVPVVVPSLTLPLPFQDLQSLPPQEQEIEVEKLAVAEAQRPFNLESGPLLRSSLLKLAPERHIFLLTMHHIVGDEWSLEQLWRELRQTYEAALASSTPSLPELPITYADYAHWQRSQQANGRFDDALTYWQNQLAGELPHLQLPTDSPRPATASDHGGMRRQTLPVKLLPALRHLSQQHKTTLFMTLMAAFQTLLHRYSQQADILIGTPITNRSQPETQHLVGLFLNTLVIRGQIEAERPFTTLLTQTRQTMLDAFVHQELPFEQLVQAIQPQRNPATNPLFQVMFVYQKEEPVLANWPGATLTRRPVDGGVSKFDLTLFVTEADGTLTAAIEYRTDLFTAATVDRMLAHFEVLLTGIVAAPETAVAHLPLLTANEKTTLAAWQQPPPVDFGSRPDAIYSLIEKFAQETPTATAVSSHNQQLTYAQLNEQANQLAHYLQAKGTNPGDRIALYLPRSPEMIVSILAIHKAGCAYVPLDPSYPAERLAWMLEDAQATLLLTQKPMADQFAGRVTLVDIEAERPQISQRPADDTAVPPNPDALAYIIYTSGSTGKPKGVMVNHRNLRHATLARHHYYPHKPERFLLLSSVAFDSSIVGIFGALSQGGHLVLPQPGQEQNVQQLAQIIAQNKITHLLALPSLYTLLLEGAAPAQLESLIDVIVAGESCPPQLVQAHDGRLPHTMLYNEYGPTEGTVWSTVYQIEPDWQGSSVPIGKPIPNTAVRVLDAHQQPVPVGVPGELYVGGAGVVTGYWQRPQLTAERFVTLCPGTPSDTFYRTGDLVCWLPDGNLQFLGRVDQQIKLRGFRIELGEIESVIKSHATVVETAVRVHKSGTGGEQLIAYLVWQSHATPDIDTIRQHLAAQLPAYMVPSHFITLDSLPRTPNGKLDRQALPDSSLAASSQAAYTPPQNETEMTIANIWAELLEQAQVGRDDNFFESGGHSLLATQLMSRVQQTFDVVLPLQNLFNAPTVAALAGAVIQAQQTQPAAPSPTIRRASRDAYRRQG
ncbi:non-ribosomal peptide synthetase [Candidatus Leptofilum sp.]|uniref:non-ribosomal peptide synthetase n=1 Tax=Candidatus Leptofilum sp. TaxID=3241576 RepID=UPI003B593541